MVAVQMQDDLRRVLDDEGKVLPGAKVPQISDETLARIFDVMLQTRIMDDRMMRLQRQGRLGFYMKAIGEEASHFAVVPLRMTDWVFPSYREQGAWFWRGYPIDTFVQQLFGNEQDPIKGRQMPIHHSANWLNLVSISSPVGTQIPQAVGTAMAMKASGTDDVAVAYFGEGTSSTGEFHVAMNFAGVMRAPVVLVCQNNQWAISTPFSVQTAAPTIAIKGLGYGIESLRVDGNDVCAVYVASRYATEKARRGGGATFLELLTYRVSAHSSSDDPSRYRDESITRVWKSERDPIHRMVALGTARGWLAAGEVDRMAAEIEAEVREVVAAQEQIGPPPVASLIDDVFEEPTWLLREQLEELKR
jgi:pyruvate dehydrogenase E1 component alpha subunit